MNRVFIAKTPHLTQNIHSKTNCEIIRQRKISDSENLLTGFNSKLQRNIYYYYQYYYYY